MTLSSLDNIDISAKILKAAHQLPDSRYIICEGTDLKTHRVVYILMRSHGSDLEKYVFKSVARRERFIAFAMEDYFYVPQEELLFSLITPLTENVPLHSCDLIDVNTMNRIETGLEHDGDFAILESAHCGWKVYILAQNIKGSVKIFMNLSKPALFESLKEKNLQLEDAYDLFEDKTNG